MLLTKLSRKRITGVVSPTFVFRGTTAMLLAYLLVFPPLVHAIPAFQWLSGWNIDDDEIILREAEASAAGLPSSTGINLDASASSESIGRFDPGPNRGIADVSFARQFSISGSDTGQWMIDFNATLNGFFKLTKDAIVRENTEASVIVDIRVVQGRYSSHSAALAAALEDTYQAELTADDLDDLSADEYTDTQADTLFDSGILLEGDWTFMGLLRATAISDAICDLCRAGTAESNFWGSTRGLNIRFEADAIQFPPTPVPEPATLCLIGFGLAGLGFMRKRKSV